MDAPRDISDPVSRQRCVFLRTGADTDGELLEVDLHVNPGAFVRSHVHPTQVETFTGVEGTLVLDVGGETIALGPGETVVIPPRIPHGFRRAAGSSRLLVTVRPALALDDYFRAFLGLSRDRRISLPSSGLPRGLLQLALVMDRYAPEMAAPGIPLGLQRKAWAALAALGRKRGLKASFPEYGAP